MNLLTSLTLKGKLILGAAALLLIVAVVAGIYFKGKRAGENVVEVATQAGASKQRETDQRITIERTEQGNAAAAKIERDPVARRDGCLRHSRTPQNC